MTANHENSGTVEVGAGLVVGVVVGACVGLTVGIGELFFGPK